MIGSCSSVGSVVLPEQVFREWHVLGDSGAFIPGDTPRPVPLSVP